MSLGLRPKEEVKTQSRWNKQRGFRRGTTAMQKKKPCGNIRDASVSRWQAQGAAWMREKAPRKRSRNRNRFSAESPVSDLVEGRKVFEAKNCSQCHSIFERERKTGPKLQSSRFYGSFLDIFSILWNHAPAMAVHMRKEVLERPQFSTTELNQLISFLYMLPIWASPAIRGEGRPC
jgi:mono/diheme cytochrome c family protein